MNSFVIKYLPSIGFAPFSSGKWVGGMKQFISNWLPCSTCRWWARSQFTTNKHWNINTPRHHTPRHHTPHCGGCWQHNVQQTNKSDHVFCVSTADNNQNVIFSSGLLEPSDSVAYWWPDYNIVYQSHAGAGGKADNSSSSFTNNISTGHSVTLVTTKAITISRLTPCHFLGQI